MTMLPKIPVSRAKLAELRALRRPSEPWELKEREINGRFVRETADEIMAPALERRRRLGVREKDLRSQYAGTTLGRLYLSEEIDYDQYAAVIKYGQTVETRRKVLGHPSPHPKSPFWDSVGGASYIGEETTSQERIDRVKKAYADMYRALAESPFFDAYLKALRLVYFHDARPDIGDLREAANVLHRHWR